MTMQSVAVIPAAGLSRRMGRPKLLERWSGKPLIAHTIEAWLAGGVTAVAVVVRADDEPLRDCLRNLSPQVHTVVAPEAPPEMLASLRWGLRWVEAHFSPAPSDIWLLAPADLPTLDPRAVEAVIARAAESSGEIVAASYQGRRGHPLAFRWTLTPEILALASDRGIRPLLDRHRCEHVELALPRPQDIDTPDDLARLRTPAHPPPSPPNRRD